MQKTFKELIKEAGITHLDFNRKKYGGPKKMKSVEEMLDPVDADRIVDNCLAKDEEED